MPINHFNCCLLEISFSNFTLCIMWTTVDPVHDGVVIRASLNLHMTFIIHAIVNSFLILDLMILFGFDFPPLYLKLNFGPHGTSPIYNEIFVCTNINLHITILLHWLFIQSFGLLTSTDLGSQLFDWADLMMDRSNYIRYLRFYHYRNAFSAVNYISVFIVKIIYIFFCMNTSIEDPQHSCQVFRPICFNCFAWREQDNFQWDYNEVRFVHAELELHSTSSVKQQSADKHAAPHGHIILIPSQPDFALSP